MSKTKKYSFKGFNIKPFLKGRKKLVVMVVGALIGYVTTQNPMLAGLAGAGGELIFAAFDFYLKA